MRMHPVVVAGVGLIVALFAASWIYDYVATSAHVDPITIVGKRHKDGYTRQDCTTDDRGRQRCKEVWEPPAWLVTYSDGGSSREVSLSSEAYDRLSVGDRKWVSYQRGGFWGTRYGESILSRPPEGESAR